MSHMANSISSKDKILREYPDAEVMLWYDYYHIQAGITKWPQALTIAEAWDYAWACIEPHQSYVFGE